MRRYSQKTKKTTNKIIFHVGKNKDGTKKTLVPSEEVYHNIPKYQRKRDYSLEKQDVLSQRLTKNIARNDLKTLCTEVDYVTTITQLEGVLYQFK